MKDFWSVTLLVCALISALGGVVKILEYVGIEPKHLIVKLPKWSLLVISILQFFLSAVCFRYSLYWEPHRPWLYLAAVLYFCALGVLWLLLSRSRRETAQELKNREAFVTVRMENGLASAEKVGALRVLAEEADWLVSTLKAVFQWIDTNDKRSEEHTSEL